jgi:hypothetical protein
VKFGSEILLDDLCFGSRPIAPGATSRGEKAAAAYISPTCHRAGSRRSGAKAFAGDQRRRVSVSDTGDRAVMSDAAETRGKLIGYPENALEPGLGTCALVILISEAALSRPC